MWCCWKDTYASINGIVRLLSQHRCGFLARCGGRMKHVVRRLLFQHQDSVVVRRFERGLICHVANILAGTRFLMFPPGNKDARNALRGGMHGSTSECACVAAMSGVVTRRKIDMLAPTSLLTITFSYEAWNRERAGGIATSMTSTRRWNNTTLARS